MLKKNKIKIKYFNTFSAWSQGDMRRLSRIRASRSLPVRSLLQSTDGPHGLTSLQQ
uniref:Uncharacterized protein n=1 Tax=Anguilla anguilla TaxID=7936 RepID=A0A0E9RA08_ANGAN